jgi:hypothetical protein
MLKHILVASPGFESKTSLILLRQETKLDYSVEDGTYARNLGQRQSIYGVTTKTLKSDSIGASSKCHSAYRTAEYSVSMFSSSPKKAGE